MQESSQYAIGLDIGTTKVRTVVAHIDSSTGVPSIVGFGQATSSGMRKGVVVNLQGPGQAIDKALGEAERMSGYQVNGATLSVNGSHILTTHADGMVAVTGPNQEVSIEDLDRIRDMATSGKIPANRDTLSVIPHSYRLDGQDGIKDPLGMTGTRLEIDAHVVSALTPYIENVEKTAESAQVAAHAVVPTAMAAARAVLTEAQLENGVAVIDMGGATTSVAVYEEGDLQYTGVVPIGGINITNDLAIGLKTDPEVAELVKLKHACALGKAEKETVEIKHEKETHTFSSEEMNEIVEARLEEIFEGIQAHLKKAGRAGRLPSGVVMVGGGSKLRHLADYAKATLGLAARLGKPAGFGGVADDIDKAEFATAIGLMLIDAEQAPPEKTRGYGKSKGPSAKDVKGGLSKILNLFKS